MNKDTIQEIREVHERIGKLLNDMEAAQPVDELKPDPLEGKSVEGFRTGAVSTGLIVDRQQLFCDLKNGVFCVASSPINLPPTPHHLTRVTEHTVGKFYLIEGCSGDNPTHFSLYLGDSYVKWSTSANAPIFTGTKMNTISMYEVTPTL